MSSSEATEATKPKPGAVNADAPEGVAAADKGKGKSTETETPPEVTIEVEEEDDEDDEEEEEEDDEDDLMDEDEDLEEIDPTAIQSRRTRGVRVDYSSAEALEKAGLKPEDLEKEDD